MLRPGILIIWLLTVIAGNLLLDEISRRQDALEGQLDNIYNLLLAHGGRPK